MLCFFQVPAKHNVTKFVHDNSASFNCALQLAGGHSHQGGRAYEMDLMWMPKLQRHDDNGHHVHCTNGSYAQVSSAQDNGHKHSGLREGARRAHACVLDCAMWQSMASERDKI